MARKEQEDPLVVDFVEFSRKHPDLFSEWADYEKVTNYSFDDWSMEPGAWQEANKRVSDRIREGGFMNKKDYYVSLYSRFQNARKDCLKPLSSWSR